jgi:hypothetical protein
MRIDEQRNLVIPVVTDTITRTVEEQEVSEEIVKVYAFHTPISRAIFEMNYRVLAATKSALASKGSHYLMSAGPRIAAMTLKDEGRKDAAARGSFDKEGVVVDEETPAFLAELKRLTMVLCSGPNGWDLLPVDRAIASGHLDDEDWGEALSSVVFFTSHVSMAKKADRPAAMKATASLLGASLTSSSPTEFVASLQNSTPVEPMKKTVSSIPS